MMYQLFINNHCHPLCIVTEFPVFNNISSNISNMEGNFLRDRIVKKRGKAKQNLFN